MDSEWTTPVNIGNPNEITINELVGLLCRMTHTKAGIVFHPLSSDDPKHRCPDISFIRNELGWKPNIPPKEGLLKTIEHLRM